jgi:hypothetical protein
MSSRSIDTFVVVIALAGCNGLLGIDPVTPAMSDRDGDGIPDGIDNCPDVPNPLQVDRNPMDGIGDVCECTPNGLDTDHDGIDDGCDECVGPGPTGNDSNHDGIDDGCEPCPTAIGQDVDHDGIDDGCDSCLLGGPHDEDHDLVPDACDNCPGLANSNQAMAMDGDSIGDACDRDTAPEMQRAFDPFTSIDIAVWQQPAIGWTTSGDDLIVEPGADAVRISAIAVPAISSGEVFVVETSVTTPATKTAGLIAEGAIGGIDYHASCTIDANRTLTVVNETRTAMSPMAVPGTGPVRLRFSIVANFGNLSTPYTYDCDAIDDVGAVITTAEVRLMTSKPGGVIELDAESPVTFSYLWMTTQ